MCQYAFLPTVLWYNQMVFWDFKNQNSIQITEGSDNGDSDNRGSTVYPYAT